MPPEWYAKFANTVFPRPANWKDTPDPRMDRNAEPERWNDYWSKNLEEFQRVYYAMTANLDWNVGRILHTLAASGMEDDTIVMFSSDHGEMFGAQGRIFKMTFYEEAVRVPMLIRWPGKIAAGSTSDACMTTPDIMPTLLGLMNLPIPKQVEGLDLSPLAQGQAGPTPDFAFLQGMGHTYRWNDGYEWRAVRDNRYTYAIYRSDGFELLFDHTNDPLQTENLAQNPKFESVLVDLRQKLASKRESLNDTFQACSWYRDHWTRDRLIIRGAKGPFRRDLGTNVEIDSNSKPH